MFQVKIWLQTPTYWELFNPTSWITTLLVAVLPNILMYVNQKHLFSVMLRLKQIEKLDKKTLCKTVLHFPVTAACPVIAI
jgi:uncharacterized membrane protein